MKAVEEKSALEGWTVGSEGLRHYDIRLTQGDLRREFLRRRAEAGRQDDDIPRRESLRLEQQAISMVDARLGSIRPVAGQATDLGSTSLGQASMETDGTKARSRGETAKKQGAARRATAAVKAVSDEGLRRRIGELEAELAPLRREAEVRRVRDGKARNYMIRGLVAVDDPPRHGQVIMSCAGQSIVFDSLGKEAWQMTKAQADARGRPDLAGRMVCYAYGKGRGN